MCGVRSTYSGLYVELRRKKAPLAGEAARLFGIHKIFATDLNLVPRHS